MGPLTLKTVLRRSTEVASRLFEGQMLIITPDDSMLHRLNEVGTYIWEYLEAPHSIEQICTAVEERFSDFDHTRNCEEIIGFLEDIRAKKMIVAENGNE